MGLEGRKIYGEHDRLNDVYPLPGSLANAVWGILNHHGLSSQLTVSRIVTV